MTTTRDSRPGAAAFEPQVPLPPIDGLRFRRLVRPDDYRRMNAAANAIRAADGDFDFTTDEYIESYYEHLNASDVDRDVLIAEVAGELVGYGRCGHATRGDGTPLHEVVLMLLPEWVGRDIEEAMLAAIEGRARQVAAELGRPDEGVFETDSSDTAVWRRSLLERAGYHGVRWAYEMIRATLDDEPDAPLPPGLEIRDVQPEHLRQIWEAEVEAFRDGWGFREPAEGDFELWCADDIQGDASLWRVAWDGDQVAGMVRGYINDEVNRRLGGKRGYVENISVRRPWRRRGLARALIAATIPLLRARGMTEGALGVDSENPSGALRLYESVGFRRAQTFTIWHKPLAHA